MVTTYIHKCASVVLNIKMTDPALQLWSTHSIRVIAANLLHRANLADSYIMTRLCWKSAEFFMYLRNTIYAADNHTKAMNVNLGPIERQRASYKTSQHSPIKKETRKAEPYKSLVLSITDSSALI